MEAEAVFRPSADVVSQQVEGEVVLVNLHTNRIFTLNETAARVWELLEAGCSRTEMKSRLLEEFDVDPEHLELEMTELLSNLSAENLIVPEDRG